MGTPDQRQRFYRSFNDTERWKTFRVRKDTSDLYIRAAENLSREAEETVTRARQEIEKYIAADEKFLHSLTPLPVPAGAPAIVRSMADAGTRAGTGPLAAVAGAIAEAVGRELEKFSEEVIVENGGDIWITAKAPVLLKVYGGGVFFGEGIAIKLNPGQTPCGVCTSSGKLGHSISRGRADAVTIIGENAALADAVATEAANRVKCIDCIGEALDYALSVEGINGALVIIRDRIGARGTIELAPPEDT